MTDAILWAIFVLLFLALVLQIITARRGPWERPMKVCVPVQCPDEDEVVIEGFYTTVVGIEPRALRESQKRWEAVLPGYKGQQQPNRVPIPPRSSAPPPPPPRHVRLID